MEPVSPKAPNQILKERRQEAFLRAQLREGEEVVRIADIHAGIYWKSAALLLLSLFLLTTLFNLGVFMMIVTIIVFSAAYLAKYYLFLAVTTQRVLIRHGIINLDTIDMPHERIESVELARTIMGRLLGYATVVISGTGSRVAIIPFIADAESFRAAVDELVFKSTQKK